METKIERRMRIEREKLLFVTQQEKEGRRFMMPYFLLMLLLILVLIWLTGIGEVPKL